MKRPDGREPDQFRQIKITKNYLAHPIASVMIEMGGTKVLCAVSVENKVPNWMYRQKVAGGWVTCEYGMLPSSTHDRMKRESSSGRQGGRTMEIQRLIGRSLRSVVDLSKLGQNTFYIDCDVIDADGGTRCASITGASIALQLAFQQMYGEKKNPMRENIGAISVGIVNGKPVLDLCYDEDSKAEVDMNVVMTESGKFIEIQGTAEQEPFSDEELQEMLSLAKDGIRKIFSIQSKIVQGNGNGNGAHRNGNGGNGGRPRPGEKLGNLGDVLDKIKV
jgi:ribonuclease PH